jgi:anti-repressor protein
MTKIEKSPEIFLHQGKNVVSARELYNALGYASQHWVKWLQKNITKNQFSIIDVDWVELPLSGRSRNFALSIDFAKRLAMLARTEQGEGVRKYFIECEALALSNAKPRSQIELLVESVNILQTQDKRLSEVETKVNSLEARSHTSWGYYSIAGYASLQRKSIDIKMASALGSKAKAACRTIGCVLGNIPDPRFGRVNTYPEEILQSVFNDFFNQAGQ